MDAKPATEEAMEEKALWLTRDDTKPDPHAGYSAFSLALHWLTVAAVFLLFVTSGPWHVTLGLVLSLPILFRFYWRWSRGFPRVADESILLSAFERIAIIVNLIALFLLTASGLALAAFSGSIPFMASASAFSSSGTAVEISRSIHSGASITFYGSIALHLLSAVRHARYRSTGILLRIMKPQPGGS